MSCQKAKLETSIEIEIVVIFSPRLLSNCIRLIASSKFKPFSCFQLLTKVSYDRIQKHRLSSDAQASQTPKHNKSKGIQPDQIIRNSSRFDNVITLIAYNLCVFFVVSDSLNN